MLREIYERVYKDKSNFEDRELKLYITPDLIDYYDEIINDIEIGKTETKNILSEFLEFGLDVSYPEVIRIEKLPIIKYKGKLYPILGEEDGKKIIINKAFYTPDYFPMILDLDENSTYSLPISYKLNKSQASSTITHEFLHHALRDRMTNETIVYKLTEKLK